jgi:hypothetical protein
MKLKRLGSATVLVAAFAFVLAPLASASETKYQMMLGAPDDPNVYCSGGCGTNACCVVG